MFHYVYKTVRKSTGEYYIGVHSTTNKDDRYVGSGFRIKRLVAKYGKSDFERIILCECSTREEAFAVEQLLVTEDLLQDPLCLNLTTGGKGNAGHSPGLSEKAKLELSALHTGKKLSVETKRRISTSKTGLMSSLKGRTRPAEVGQKISAANKGRPKSEEHKRKISATTTGRERPPEVSAKIAAHRKTHPFAHSAESIERMRTSCANREKLPCPHCGVTGGIAQLKRWHFDNCPLIGGIRTGKIPSAETRAKISAAQVGIPHTEDAKQKMRKPKALVVCPHCGSQGGISQMKRWHFDNCPKKQPAA